MRTQSLVRILPLNISARACGARSLSIGRNIGLITGGGLNKEHHRGGVGIGIATSATSGFGAICGGGRRFQSTQNSPPREPGPVKQGNHAEKPDDSPSTKDSSNKSSSAEDPSKSKAVATEEKPKPKMTIWEKVKHEAQHYWDGTKLLGYEVRVSTKLAAKMAAGYELTRRENRQLKRTVQDIIRLVPFSMFLIVPFAELLLPVALKIFPNLLPSTYESGKEKEAKYKKLRNVRGGVSTFLKETISEGGMALPASITPEQREQFATFFKQIRSEGQAPSKELVTSVAQMFKDDTVLDNLSRPQLVAMAKYMNLQPFGTNLMLRYRIRHRMRQIKRDDRAIDYEGVDSLSVTELQIACASRGIKTHGVSPGKLRDDLGTWLELRLHQKVPSTLLVLSTAYTYREAENLESYYEGIQSVLSALPEEVYHEAELEVSSEAATNKQRLEVIKEQQELIQDENAEEEESGHVIKVKDNLSLDENEGGEQVEGEKGEQLESNQDAESKSAPENASEPKQENKPKE